MSVVTRFALAALALSSLVLATTAAAQTRLPAEDLLGPCNEISAVGPCANKPLPATGLTTFPPTLANLEMCRSHFKDIKWADEYKRAEIANRRGASPAEKDALWKEYVASRDEMSAKCARSFSELARAGWAPQPSKPYRVDPGSCETPYEIDWQALFAVVGPLEMLIDVLLTKGATGRWSPADPLPSETREWALSQLILDTVPSGKTFQFKNVAGLYRLVIISDRLYRIERAPCT